MRTYEDKLKEGKDFLEWCESNGLHLTPIQKILFANLPFNGGCQMRQAVTYKPEEGK